MTARPEPPARHLWLLPLLMLAAAGVAATFVLWRPEWPLGVALTLLLGGGMLWIVVSVFWPAKADRSCPACGEEAVVRLDPDSTTGLRCEACGHVDRDATAWFLAEEEGPLEDLVLRGRGRSAHTGGR